MAYYRFYKSNLLEAGLSNPFIYLEDKFIDTMLPCRANIFYIHFYNLIYTLKNKGKPKHVKYK